MYNFLQNSPFRIKNVAFKDYKHSHNFASKPQQTKLWLLSSLHLKRMSMSSANSISPEKVGFLLPQILDLLKNAATAAELKELF